MIAKIWKYELHKDVKGGAAQQNAAYDIALGSSSYILGVSSDASAIEAFELAQRVGNYVGAPDVDPERTVATLQTLLKLRSKGGYARDAEAATELVSTLLAHIDAKPVPDGLDRGLRDAVEKANEKWNNPITSLIF